MKIARPFAAALIAAAAAAPGAIAQPVRPSFDCAAASTPAERAICASPVLARTDHDLGVAYRARLAADPALKAGQVAWIKARDAQCGGDAACIEQLERARLAALQSSAGPTPAGGMPTRIGQCVQTTIAQLGSRLEGMPDSGSAASYANGGDQVDYDVSKAVSRWRVGDAVKMCLVSLPQDCPPGDDRGKVYVTTDLRTGGSWQAADAEHSCGGA